MNHIKWFLMNIWMFIKLPLIYMSEGVTNKAGGVHIFHDKSKCQREFDRSVNELHRIWWVCAFNILSTLFYIIISDNNRIKFIFFLFSFVCNFTWILSVRAQIMRSYEAWNWHLVLNRMYDSLEHLQNGVTAFSSEEFRKTTDQIIRNQFSRDKGEFGTSGHSDYAYRKGWHLTHILRSMDLLSKKKKKGDNEVTSGEDDTDD